MESETVPTSPEDQKSRLSAAGWLALLVLAAFFVISLWYAVKVWTAMAGVHMSGWGWLFLVLGVVVTIALGAGLMALVFYSARHDMDR
jgi:ABC-type multidrug transport system permease subunit